MSSRIDVGFEVLPGVDYLSVQYPTGTGWVTVPIVAGTYWTLQELADAIETALHLVSDGDLFCDLEGAALTTFRFFTSGSNFDIRFDSVALRDHCGILSSSYTNQSTRSGFSTKAVTLDFSAEWTSVELAEARKVEERDRNDVAIVPLSHWRTWELRYAVPTASVAAVRAVLAYALEGNPCAWTPDTDESDPIDWDVLNGVVRGTLEQPGYSDDWMDEAQQTLTLTVRVREDT